MACGCLAVALSVAQPKDMYEIRWKLRMDAPIRLSRAWTSSCGDPAQSRAFTDCPRVGATNSDRIAAVLPPIIDVSHFVRMTLKFKDTYG